MTECRSEIVLIAAEEAGQRIHGTTCARPAVVFAEAEAPLLLAAPAAPYAVPIYAEVKVHRDPECPICSRDPHEIADEEMGVFPDYEAFCAAAG